MLCQNCGKDEATTHIKRVEGGTTVELHLCSGCAAHLGYDGFFSGFGRGMGALMESVFQNPLVPKEEEKEHCPSCGFTFDQVVETGMLGCAECYYTFAEQLKPSLMRIHGRAVHVGKKGGEHHE